jgi:nitrite reductase/ring-hydroxylating ferredoxin subunit
MITEEEMFKLEFERDGDIRHYEAVCPHCFQEQRDSWEYEMRDGEERTVSCQNCDKEFEISCSISVYYTSSLN